MFIAPMLVGALLLLPPEVAENNAVRLESVSLDTTTHTLRFRVSYGIMKNQQFKKKKVENCVIDYHVDNRDDLARMTCGKKSIQMPEGAAFYEHKTVVLDTFDYIVERLMWFMNGGQAKPDTSPNLPAIGHDKIDL